MSQNIWQIESFTDLVRFLKSGENKFIILSLVLPTTQKSIVSSIKKFIKRKSHVFSNILFLYYTVRPEDMNKISFISNDIEVYPKMCHIYNTTEMLLEVEAIDCTDVLEDSFAKIESHYIEHLNHVSNHSSNKISNNSDISSGSGENTMQNNNQTIPNENPIKAMQSEKRKFAKKLEYLKKKSDEYTLIFMEDCRKRKKEEEKKNRNKNK